MTRKDDRGESPAYLLFMLILSVCTLAILAASSLPGVTPETRSILEYADNAICLLFFLDFFVSLSLAEDRRRYFLRWGWLDLLSSVPMIDALRWGRFGRILRIIRVLRGLRAAKIIAELLFQHRAKSVFLATCLLSILLVVSSAVAILQVESATQGNIKTAEDAIWWSFVTITTVGYGDYYPTSSEGRIIAVLLMTAGVGLFGTFSGLVASWFLNAPNPRGKDPDLQTLLAEIAELKALLREQTKRPVLLRPDRSAVN